MQCRPRRARNSRVPPPLTKVWKSICYWMAQREVNNDNKCNTGLHDYRIVPDLCQLARSRTCAHGNMAGRPHSSRRGTPEPRFASAPRPSRHDALCHSGILFRLCRADRSGLGQARQTRSLEAARRAKCRYLAGCAGRHFHEYLSRRTRGYCTSPVTTLSLSKRLRVPHPAICADLRQRQFLPGDFQPDPALPARRLPDSLYSAAEPPGRGFFPLGHLWAIYHSDTHFPVTISGTAFWNERISSVPHHVLHPAWIDETYFTNHRP